MSLIIANGLLVKEAYYLYSDLVSENPVIPAGMAIYSYDSIGADDQLVGIKGWLGSDVEFNFLEPIYNTVGNTSLVKTATMTTDFVYEYTVLAGDISDLGSNLTLSEVIVNKEKSFANISYENFPISAGEKITISGLPLVSQVTSLKLKLSA